MSTIARVAELWADQPVTCPDPVLSFLTRAGDRLLDEDELDAAMAFALTHPKASADRSRAHWLRCTKTGCC